MVFLGRKCLIIVLSAALLLFAGCSTTPAAPRTIPKENMRTEVVENSTLEALVTSSHVITSSPEPEEKAPKDGLPLRMGKDTPAEAEIARSTLAARLDVPVEMVKLVSIGEWTMESIACELDLGFQSDPSPDLTIFPEEGLHRKVVLSVKGKSYEYWLFRSMADIPMAFPCKFHQ